MATTPILLPLTTNEQAGHNGATHMAIITADMLTMVTANTVQDLTLMDLVSGDYIVSVWWRLKTAFQDVSDAAFNVTTMSVGDNASPTTFIAATELNVNGTEVFNAASFTAVGPYAAASAIKLRFTSMAAKALNDIDRGEVEIFFIHLRPKILEQATAAQAIAK